MSLLIRTLLKAIIPWGFAFLLLFLGPAMADPVQIAGPQGPLEGELISAEGITDIVLIIPGSGPTDRDGNAPQMGLSTDMYKLLAEGLATHGIGTLRIDKRGMYGSAAAIADPNDVTIAAYAEDVRNWVRYATNIAPCVWIAGHSEGGLVALVAAQDAPDSLCGIILLATPGRPLGQVMLEQFEANPANGPLLPELRSIIADLEAGRSRAAATLTPALQPFFTDGLQAYMIDLFSYDPVQMARTWQGPALIIQGDADIQVRAQDADLFASALPQAGRINLAQGTHVLKVAVPDNPLATYTNPALPLHPDLVTGVVQFIDAH